MKQLSLIIIHLLPVKEYAIKLLNNIVTHLVPRLSISIALHPGFHRRGEQWNRSNSAEIPDPPRDAETFLLTCLPTVLTLNESTRLCFCVFHSTTV